ncbi:glycosyltransferase family 39 protein [uncultured Thioclava sp.]|uniref:ArnT family glycosyltransferase n=1 Tax=uncultured Thioclava sp. TaxID=473858 RepID=UPI0025FEFDE4|nr:glycosyltransferase family 39 protein [uncultured Thioclava sp.]
MAPAGFTGATRPSNLWVRNGLPTLLLISVATLAFHAALALWVPVFQDESYYALWATRPAIDYYDHPPMIALWIWAGRAIFGTTFLGVRVVSVLTLALVPAMVYRIAWLVSHDRRTAQVAALFYATMTTPIVLGFSSTPDSPSVVFWAFSTMALFEAIKDPARKSTGWFAIFGVALGLGVLSKFTNLFLILGIGMWLIFTRPGRRIFARSGAWVAIGATVVTVLPFLIWNAQHEWYGFQRQFSRLDVGALPHSAYATYLVIILVTVLPPLLWFLGRGVMRTSTRSAILLWLNLPLLIYFAFHSSHARVQANWLAPVFPALSVMCALGAPQYRKVAIYFAAGVSALFSVIALGLALWPGPPVFPGDNPFNQTKGWAQLSNRLEAFAHANNARWIAVTDYGTTGELAFHISTLPVWSITQTMRYNFRGDFPKALCEQPALLIEHGMGPTASSAQFDVTSSAIVFHRVSAGIPIADYTATVVQQLKDCPPPSE